MLSSATALVAHKRIVQETTGQPNLVKIALNNAGVNAQIFVKTLTGKTITCEVDLMNTTVSELKLQI